MEIIRIPISELTPDPNNAKDHPEEQIQQIEESIRRWGFNDPLGVWGDENLIVEGHGRYEALKRLGYDEVECIRLDQLTDEERRAYALVHNNLTMNTGWIPAALDLNLDAIGTIDMSLFGFKGQEDWFQTRERFDNSRQEGNDEYNDFLDKFEQTKTTDDCYTPDKVYDAVADWVANEYNVKRSQFVRPFYPGGNYQEYKYKKGDVVVDNPPFSILSDILKWYTEHGVKFFLFAPSLTLFSSSSSSCAIGAGAQIIYENGASVSTSFLTNLEMEYRFRSCPTLYGAVENAVAEILKEQKKQFPKNDYPDAVVLSTMLNRYSKYGVDFRVKREESQHVRQLDEQKESGRTLFGSGYLISERAAAERAAAARAAAERAAAEKWALSERELEIVRSLGGDRNEES